MLKIVNVPNQVLSSPTKPVEAVTGDIKKLVKDMEKTLIAQVDPQGVGLAAPQVGVSLRLFIIKPGEDDKTEVFINPVILEKHIKKERAQNSKPRTHNSKLEGCLSIPKIWGPVKRANRVLLKYQTLNGQEKTQWFTGLKATIIQHEVDHLQGVLFTQRSLEQDGPLYEEQGDEFVKIDKI